MLNRRKLWLDGKLVPFGRAKVHIMSHSFCRGSAIFEVMSLHDTAWGTAVFRLDEHIKRLQRSASMVRMKLPYSGKKIKDAVLETVRSNRVRQGMIKLMCYYGGVEFEVIPRDPVVSMAVVVADPAKDLGSARFNKGMRKPAELTIGEYRKWDPATFPVEAKSAASYLPGMVAKMDAIDKGFTGPILLDTKGFLAEGPTESLFLVKNGVLKTPALGNVLSGITRMTVLELAEDIGIDTVEKKIRPAELMTADEVFVTSSIVKIWSVCRVEDKTLQAPGPITELLDKSMEKILTGKVKGYKKWFNAA